MPPLDDLLRKARLRLLRMHYEAGAGHIGGNLSALDAMLLVHGIRIGRFHHAYARGYPSRTFGSQSYHRRESGLSAAAILDGMQERKA
jgi:transketolase